MLNCESYLELNYTHFCIKIEPCQEKNFNRLDPYIQEKI